MYSLSGMLLKEPRQGNVREIAEPFILIRRNPPIAAESKTRTQKNTNGGRKSDEFNQRGLPGILEASNSSAP